MSFLSLLRNFDGEPNIVTIVTNDTQAEILSPGYLELPEVVESIDGLQNGEFQWENSDVYLIDCIDGKNFYTRDSATNAFVALSSGGGGGGSVVNPGLMNQVAYYAADGTEVSGLPTANSAAFRTNATGAPGWSASMTNGQVLMGVTAGTPVPANITAGAGISIANGPASIQISGTASSIGWTEVTGPTQAMVADSGYIANDLGIVTLTLPVTAAVGTQLALIGKGVGGWVIAQNAGQNIQIGAVSSTVGVGGSVASSNEFDSVMLICTTADTTWTTLGGPQSSGLNIV